MTTNRKKRRRSSLNRRRVFIILLGLAVLALFARSARVIFKPPQRNIHKRSASSVPTKGPKTASAKKNTRIAIIIDDIGYNLKLLDKLLAIEGELTYSVLPDTPYAAEAARRIKAAGHEVMLHLPMEPQNVDRWVPTPDTLLTSMDEKKIREIVEKHLKAVPGAVGVNNHMGSWFTEDESGMAILFGILKGKGLFFVDSRTTPNTVGCSKAAEIGLDCRQSDLFLDGKILDYYVAKQWDLLIQKSRANGRAIAIGHPHAVTIETLAREIPKLGQQGLTLVPASRISQE